MLGTTFEDLAIGLDPSLLFRGLGFTPDPWQEDILRSTDERLMVLAYRQSGKSSAVASLALHLAVFRPDSLTIIVSRSQRQSSELFNKVCRFWRQLGRPHGAVEQNATTLTLNNESRIVSLPPNPDTTVGFSAPQLVILDEGSRIPDSVLAAVLPMLLVSEGRLISMSTPKGRSGWFSEAWHDPASPWRKVAVTAYDVGRVNKEWLEEQRAVLGPKMFAREFLCEFQDADDAVFSMDDILGAFRSDRPPFLSELAL